MERCEKLIKESCPSINDDIYSYIEGVLTVGKDDFDDPDEIYDAIGELLMEVSPASTSDERIRVICQTIWDNLGLKEKNNNHKNGIRALSAPMQMSSLLSPAEETSTIWLSVMKDEGLRNVNHKKTSKG